MTDRENTLNLDCERCGACCVSNWDADSYVYVDDDDIRRLRMAYSNKTVRRLLVHEDDIRERGLGIKQNNQDLTVCVALRGEVGVSCSCRVYDARPRACRKFKPSSLECMAARDEAGIPRPTTTTGWLL